MLEKGKKTKPKKPHAQRVDSAVAFREFCALDPQLRTPSGLFTALRKKYGVSSPHHSTVVQWCHRYDFHAMHLEAAVKGTLKAVENNAAAEIENIYDSLHRIAHKLLRKADKMVDKMVADQDVNQKQAFEILDQIVKLNAVVDAKRNPMAHTPADRTSRGQGFEFISAAVVQLSDQRQPSQNIIDVSDAEYEEVKPTVTDGSSEEARCAGDSEGVRIN